MSPPTRTAIDHIVPLADILDARERIAGRLHRTPLLTLDHGRGMDHGRDGRARSPTTGSTSRPSTSRRPGRSSREG